MVSSIAMEDACVTTVSPELAVSLVEAILVWGLESRSVMAVVHGAHLLPSIFYILIVSSSNATYTGSNCQYSNEFTCLNNGVATFVGECNCFAGFGGPTCNLTGMILLPSYPFIRDLHLIFFLRCWSMFGSGCRPGRWLMCLHHRLYWSRLQLL